MRDSAVPSTLGEGCQVLWRSGFHVQVLNRAIGVLRTLDKWAKTRQVLEAHDDQCVELNCSPISVGEDSQHCYRNVLK